MARKQPQPFWREQTKYCYVQIGKKPTNASDAGRLLINWIYTPR